MYEILIKQQHKFDYAAISKNVYILFYMWEEEKESQKLLLSKGKERMNEKRQEEK